MYKNIFSLVVLVLIAFVAAGCAVTEPKVVYNPPLNKVSTKEIGQNMFSKIYAVFKYENTIEIVDENIRHNIKRNYIYDLYYFDKLEDGSCAMVSDVGSTFFIDENCTGTFTKLGEIKIIDMKKPIEYKVVPAEPTQYSYDSFKYNVLYQGKVENKLNIAFQEFVNANGTMIIRNAFTQNIQYEIDSNGEAMIGFKGLRIKVLKATNTDITYQVIKDFD